LLQIKDPTLHLPQDKVAVVSVHLNGDSGPFESTRIRQKNSYS
jgi:hypothetical protein